MRRQTPFQRKVVKNIKEIFGDCRSEFDQIDKKSNSYWLIYQWLTIKTAQCKKDYNRLLDYLASGDINFEIMDKMVLIYRRGFGKIRINCFVIVIHEDYI